MQKILIIHCRYRNLGGEDIAVNNEVKFLEEYFHVKRVDYSNQDTNLINLFLSLVFNKNFITLKTIKKEIEFFMPDYVYIHNTWFMVPFSLFKYLKKQNIKTMIKLHNFRYDCTRSYFVKNHIKNNEICPLCGMRKNKFRVFNKYFKESFLKSFFIIKYGRKYFKVLSDKYFKLIVLTNFHREYLIKLGINQNKIFVFQNFLKISQSTKRTKSTNKYIVYAGRISYEKGVDHLIKAFIEANMKEYHIKIIGDGPEYKHFKNKFSSSQVQFYGPLSNSETLDIISRSKAVTTATTLFEGQPTLLCEASSLGIPSIFPNTGGIKEFFPEGYELSFKQFDYGELVKKIQLLNNEELLEVIGNQNQSYILELLESTSLKQKFISLIDE